MQLKAFTKWWDSWLKPRGHEVTDLMEQIQPGVIDIKLIEALSGRTPRARGPPTAAPPPAAPTFA